MQLRKRLAKKEFEKLVTEAHVVRFKQGKIVELENRLKRKKYIVHGRRGEGTVEVEEVEA